MAKLSEEKSPDLIDALIEELAQKLEILRVRYEQYFLGNEKVPPSVLRTDAARMIHTLEMERIRNTALKFKLRSTIQKFNTYSTYWNRTMREIENGTYRRHLQRAEHNRKKQQYPLTASPASTQSPEFPRSSEVEEIVKESEAFLKSLGFTETKKVQRHALEEPPPATTLQKTPRVRLVGPAVLQNANPSPGSTKTECTEQTTAGYAQLYTNYASARQKLGMDTMSRESFERKVRTQAEKLKEKYKCRQIDFEISYKNDVPIIKPVIKK